MQLPSQITDLTALCHKLEASVQQLEARVEEYGLNASAKLMSKTHKITGTLK